MGEAAESAAAESDARALEEVEQREAKLSAALAEAHASLGNMRKLHQVCTRGRKALQPVKGCRGLRCRSLVL